MSLLHSAGIAWYCGQVRVVHIPEKIHCEQILSKNRNLHTDKLTES